MRDNEKPARRCFQIAETEAFHTATIGDAGHDDPAVVCDIGPYEVGGASGSNLFVATVALSGPSVLDSASLAYFIVVANAGPFAATGVTITDRLPAGIDFVSAVPSQGAPCNEAAGMVICSIGTLAAGASAGVILFGAATTDASKTNTASVTGNQSDPDSTDDTVEVVVAVSIPDSDNYGLKDNVDNCPSDLNLGQEDNDEDGVGDVCDTDDDNDGMPDAFKIANGLDALNSEDASRDLDGDGSTNLQEFLAGTDPNDPASNPANVLVLILQILLAE